MGIADAKPDINGTPGFPDGRPNKRALTAPNTTEYFNTAWAPYLDKSTAGHIWETYRVTSGPEIKKVRDPSAPRLGQIWGKYPKIYSKPPLGGGGIFEPPLYFLIDNVRVLCACRDIWKKIYRQAGGNIIGDIELKAKIASGLIIPACWEDYSSIYKPFGDTTYDIYVRHPGFYIYTVSESGPLGMAGNAVEAQADGSLGGIVPAALTGLYAYKVSNELKLIPKGGKRKFRKTHKKKRASKKLSRRRFTS